MKTKSKSFLQWLCCSLLALLILLGGAVVPLAAGEIGKKIDKTNVQDYKDVLFPALYRAVERGDFVLPTANLPFEYKHDPKFIAGGLKNEGKFDVNEAGDLIEKSTGKMPKYNVYGYPFPNIERNDPKIALKLMWNFMYMKYRFMATHASTKVSWISKETGEDRWLGDPETLLYFQGREPGQELKNPNNYLSLELQNVLAPMSVKGINSMSWDYFDDRDITQFAYIPAFRRVRQTSGAQRSDPYQGSDSWQDMGYMWSGKNRTMKWKLVGERTILTPWSSLKKDALEELPDGSIRKHIVDIKWGFETPGWKGAKWAPTSVTWVPRKVWIIEQMPKDPYYAWGLHTNYMDQETYQIWGKEVCDKAGQFRTWVMAYHHFGEAPSGRNTIADYDADLFVDEKVRHATIVERQPNPNAMFFMPASRVGPSFFTQSNFLQLSK